MLNNRHTSWSWIKIVSFWLWKLSSVEKLSCFSYSSSMFPLFKNPHFSASPDSYVIVETTLTFLFSLYCVDMIFLNVLRLWISVPALVLPYSERRLPEKFNRYKIVQLYKILDIRVTVLEWRLLITKSWNLLVSHICFLYLYFDYVILINWNFPATMRWNEILSILKVGKYQPMLRITIG